MLFVWLENFGKKHETELALWINEYLIFMFYFMVWVLN